MSKKFVLCKFGNMDSKVITAETAFEHGYLPTHNFDDGMEIFKPKWLKAIINPKSKQIPIPTTVNEGYSASHYVEEPW